MESFGFIFGIVGFSMSVIGMTFGISAIRKVTELEKKLVEKQIIESSDS